MDGEPLDLVAMTSVVPRRELLGVSVHTLRHEFAELCAAHGYSLWQKRWYGEGDSRSLRMPCVYDIKQRILLEQTGQWKCSRDGRPGAALVDVLESLGGAGSVGRATLMLS